MIKITEPIMKVEADLIGRTCQSKNFLE